MKIELTREEIIAAVTDYMNDKFIGMWKTTTADYLWPSSVVFAPDTPERAAQEAAEAAETERILAEWRKTKAAEEATKRVPEAA